MFSIFHGLFTLFAIGIDKYNKKTQDEKNKIRAKNNGNLTYYGSRGNEYLVENNKWVSTKTDLKTGHEIISDMKTGEIYYDVTEEKIKDEERKQMNKRKTVRKKMSHERNKLCGKFKQCFYLVDIESQIPVSRVYVNGVYFYIRLTDGHLLRLEDGESPEYIHGKWGLYDLISIINNRQDRYIKDIELGIQNTAFINSELFFQNTFVYVDSKGKVNTYNVIRSNAWQKKLKEEGIIYNTKLKRWINGRNN